MTRTIALRVATDDFRTCVFPEKAECLPDGLTNKGGWVAGGWRLVTGRDRVDLRDALRNAGLLFPFGSYAEYDPSDQSIVVLNTTNNIDHVRSYLRSLVGATNPAEAAPGTIRGDLALDIGRIVIHASDSPESAKREISIHFTPDDLCSYKRVDESVLYE